MCRAFGVHFFGPPCRPSSSRVMTLAARVFLAELGLVYYFRFGQHAAKILNCQNFSLVEPNQTHPPWVWGPCGPCSPPPLWIRHWVSAVI